MKKIILPFLAIIGYYGLFAQCTEVPIKEAVRNGNFEAGYLPGSSIGQTVTSHTFTAGGIFDFESDLNYAGEWKNSSDPCDYGIGDEYGVGRVEQISHPCGGGQNAIVYGQYTNSALYKDHTTGTNKGFSMFLDFLGGSGDFKTAWAQTVDIYPSQQYYFSVWLAQYGGSQNSPNIRLRVESYDAGGTMLDNQTVGNAPIARPAMNWQQFSGTYNMPATAVIAKIFIECKPAGQPASDDFMIDDISFINSCQNIANQVTNMPNFDSESISLCQNNGSVKLDVKTSDGNSLNPSNKKIVWYEGTGNTQTELTAFANSVAPKVNSTGTYRVCVEDPTNGCSAVNATINVTEELALKNIPSEINLCSPSQVTLDADLKYEGLEYLWKGPTESNTSSIVIDQVGKYTVETFLANTNCKSSKEITVTSSLPTAPTGLTHCEGQATLEVNDGKKWKWCEDQACTTLIGTSKDPVTWTITNKKAGDQTVYLQNAETDSLGTIGPSLQDFTFSANNQLSTNFTVYEKIILKSVEAKVPSWMSNSSSFIYIKNIDNQEEMTYGPFNFNTSTQATLNANLEPGNYQIYVNHSYFLTKANYTGTPQTYEIKDYISITGYSQYSYGPVSNWVIEKPLACDPIPVLLKECKAPEFTGKDFVCWYDTTTYSVSNPNPTSTYTWTYNNVTKTGKDLFVNFAKTGTTGQSLTISLVETYADGTKSLVATKQININYFSYDPVISGPSSVCEGETATFSNNETTPNYTFYWAYAHEGQEYSDFKVGTDLSVNYTNKTGSSKVATMALNQAGCFSNRTEKKITINQTPKPNLEVTPESTCIGNGVEATVGNSSGNSTFEWSVNNEKIQNANSTLNYTVITNDNTISVTETNSFGCVGIVNKKVIGLTTPSDLSITGEVFPCDKETYTYTAKAQDATSYVWTYLDGDKNIDINTQGNNIQSIDFSKTTATTGEVRVEAINNTCKSSIFLSVQVNKNCTITNIIESQDNSIVIAPNPFDNTTSISTQSSSTITIYDVNGQVVTSFENVSEVTVGESLNAGIYFINIQNEKGTFYQKIVKQ